MEGGPGVAGAEWREVSVPELGLRRVFVVATAGS
jgi:hypothetical protein